MGLCVTFLLFHIYTRTKVVELSYRSGALQKEIGKLEADLARLEGERSRQRSSETLEALVRNYAAQGVSFEKPEAKQILYFTPESL